MKLGIAMLIHNKDDIEFVIEFPCVLGHPVPRYKELDNLCKIPPLYIVHRYSINSVT